METNKLKRFAQEARINLMEGVRRKLRQLGFDEKGCSYAEPQLVQGASLWQGEDYPEDFYHQWMALRDRISEQGVREVVEEAAYTWFNRMMAIRILVKNELCEPVLALDEAVGLPLLLTVARMGRIPEMSAQQRARFEVLMDDDTKTYEQFALLLTAWCHDNAIIRNCFGSIDDYVELLLPDNILKPDGFLALLNSTDFITDDDFKSAELIGWLYQFYISDRKDEVFAKKGKVEADEIPAATQIFTPNWIVKYMVENAILPQVIENEQLTTNNEKWKYLVVNEQLTTNNEQLVELEDLKVADLACGSGHILNECFDLLFDLYRAESYSSSEAIECIFTKNLTGIDIDLRAKQLATFALLLKACQRNPSFSDARCLPHVITINNEQRITNNEEVTEFLHHFFLGSETKECSKELCAAFELLKDADTLGSIIKFDISPSTRRQLVEAISHWESQDEMPAVIRRSLPAFDFILTLTDSFDAIVMNPPYMGSGKMNDVLSNYAKKNYPDSKADLFSMFIEMSLDRLKENGRAGLITMESWMFLSSFEALRRKILDNYFISSMGHFGWHIIGIAFGTVMTIFEKAKAGNRKGEYSYLTIDDIDREINVPYIFPIKDNGRYANVSQSQFEKIPGRPIAYWASDKIRNCFNVGNPISKYGISDGQNITGDNTRYLRLWWENSFRTVGKNKKWVPCAKGGSYRKWYGNILDCINWSKEARTEYKNNSVARIQDEYLWYRLGITWNLISSGLGTGFRILPDNCLFNKAAPTIVIKDDCLDMADYILAFLNTKVVRIINHIVNPTFNTNIAEVFSLKIRIDGDNQIQHLSKQNQDISKLDWDSHETSLDFQTSPLLTYRKATIDEALEAFKEEWGGKYMQLHANEEGLNRRFIEIYGLQDELTPDVPLSEITILQAGEISIMNNEQRTTNNGGAEGNCSSFVVSSSLKWHDDVIVKQLISYIVGVWMGRYRLDKPGLHIAHPEPTDEEIAEYSVPDTGETLKIDADAIIPVLPKDAPFFDNLRNYITYFVRIVFGETNLVANINFMEKALGKSLDDYLMKDFWKDHKKMYSNRPIYWEFASKKGAFRAIVYAHRMDRYTVEVLRSKYLLPYIGHIERKIASLESRANELTTAERRELDALRSKTLPELRDYHQQVEQVAAETAARPRVFDLDDGIPANHALFAPIVTKLK